MYATYAYNVPVTSYQTVYQTVYYPPATTPVTYSVPANTSVNLPAWPQYQQQQSYQNQTQQRLSNRDQLLKNQKTKSDLNQRQIYLSQFQQQPLQSSWNPFNFVPQNSNFFQPTGFRPGSGLR